MAKKTTKNKTSKPAVESTNGIKKVRAGRQPGKYSQLIDEALSGKVNRLTFGSDRGAAKAAAYRLWGARRLKGAQVKVAVSLDSEHCVVTVGPRDIKGRELREGGRRPRAALKAVRTRSKAAAQNAAS